MGAGNGGEVGRVSVGRSACRVDIAVEYCRVEYILLYVRGVQQRRVEYIPAAIGRAPPVGGGHESSGGLGLGVRS